MRGTSGLHVVDVSVMPTIISASTDVTVLAVAEDASDVSVADR